MLKVAINNQQTAQKVDRQQLKEAVKRVLAGEGHESALISIAVVDDATIHQLNRQYLQHDYPTDVLSFVLEDEPQHLEGEIIISAEYAAAHAAEFGWTAQNEMLLYIIHGTLHLVGYDDLEPGPQAKMRAQERVYLATFGLTPKYDE